MRRISPLRSDALRRLVSVSAAELTELGTAATALEHAGLDARAATLRDLATKLRATLRTESLARIESDLETLVHAEGLATRPGPRQRLDAGLLALLREAITTERVVSFRYLAQSTGRRSSQRVQPYGLLYGNRTFLVAPRQHERGTAQRRDVRRRPDVRPGMLLFHPGQTTEENPDGSLTVCFTAGGIDEMCWYLFTWGESVTVEKLARLRRRLAEMCASLATHHHRQGHNLMTGNSECDGHVMLAEKFRGAFEQEWTERIKDSAKRERMACAFRSDGSWTKFMLGCNESPNGFLHAVGERLERCVSREWYTLDCVFYQDQPNLIEQGPYPAGLDVIVEHENGERVEEEMWKLLMWRSPLKVLIFYDYLEEEKAKHPNLDAWLEKKLENLRCMAIEMHERWPEYQSNEYLLVVGCAPRRGELPQWRDFMLLDERRWVEMNRS